ncbi:MAG: hypothetical protein GY757_53725 [bacterium]|nr:hypothetical protein [bacterium]
MTDLEIAQFQREAMIARDLEGKLGYLEVTRLMLDTHHDEVKAMLESGIILGKRPLPLKDSFRVFFAHEDFAVLGSRDPVPTYDFSIQDKGIKFERR